MLNLIDHTIIPQDPRERNAWVIYQLKLCGKTLTSVADEIGISLNAFRSTLYQPNAKAEKKLAKMLGLAPEELIPERYDAKGRRFAPLKPWRGPRPKSELRRAGPGWRGRRWRRRESGRRFSFENDDEVCEFLHEIYGRHTLSEIARQARSRFGRDRAPSRSAIHRYYQWLEQSEKAA